MNKGEIMPEIKYPVDIDKYKDLLDEPEDSAIPKNVIIVTNNEAKSREIIAKAMIEMYWKQLNEKNKQLSEKMGNN